MTPSTTSTPGNAGRRNSLTLALYFNGAMLALIVILLASGRGRSAVDSITLDSTAFGQQAPMAIAGGAGFYLMPAQFSGSSWGCYVMDVDAQTLVCYVYDPAKPGTLRLAAARNFSFDRQLRSYNTLPKPEDMEQVIKLERDTARRPAAMNPATEPAVSN